MGGPEKPFSCLESGCGASFTNEDRLSVHARKHDMVLQLGAKGGAFVADQTPTPTRFIRNCEEVGLFQDLQNVNPFDETFKRAMEVRADTSHLTLDGNIMGTSDDTLHTPHIFPHMSDENASGLYSGNTERTNLTVSRLSSDEGSNQLTVVKCLSSSLEDNLSSVGLHESEKDEKNYRKTTVLVERRIKKKSDSSSSKSKLVRQDSIDLPDDLNNANASQYDMGSESHKLTAEKEAALKDDTSDRIMQIPVISISEIPKNNMSSLECKVEVQNNSATQTFVVEQRGVANDAVKRDGKFLDIKSCLKTSYSKLISQKSIDMALVHFTNEAQCKLMDLNNISIEDLPDSTSVIKDVCSQNDTKSPETPTVNRRKRLLLSRSKSKNESEIPTESNVSNNFDDRVIPSIEAINGSFTNESQNTGYELTLKWPDGKKVYLKEVQRDLNETAEKTEIKNIVPIAKETSESKPNVKQKIKDMINNCNSHGNDSQLDTSTNIVLNPFTILPENYVIMPPSVIADQALTVPTVLANNIQFLSVVSPPKLQAQTILIPKNDRLSLPRLESNNQPVIRAVSGGNIYAAEEVMILPKANVIPNNPAKNNNSFNLRSAQKNAKKKRPNNSQKNVEVKTGIDLKNNIPDDIKRQMIQERNRIAVSRYREKKLNRLQAIQEANSKLEHVNRGLIDKLELAMKEIRKLRHALSLHAHCRLEKPNSGVPVFTPVTHQSVIFANSANIHCTSNSEEISTKVHNSNLLPHSATSNQISQNNL